MVFFFIKMIYVFAHLDRPKASLGFIIVNLAEPISSLLLFREKGAAPINSFILSRNCTRITFKQIQYRKLVFGLLHYRFGFVAHFLVNFIKNRRIALAVVVVYLFFVFKICGPATFSFRLSGFQGLFRDSHC